MPQMSPLSWLTLFILFNMTLSICLIKIWFSSSINSYTSKNNVLNLYYKQLLWKW